MKMQLDKMVDYPTWVIIRCLSLSVDLKERYNFGIVCVKMSLTVATFLFQ